MSKVVSQADLGKITDPASFITYCAKFINDLIPVFNGGLEFDLNMKTQTVSINFSNANTDQSIPHNLNKTGVKYIVAQKKLSTDIYDGLTSSTTKTLYLRSTVATTVTLILF